MSLEAQTEKALIANRCPYCGIRLYMNLSMTEIPRWALENIWRHHIATLHKETVDAG